MTKFIKFGYIDKEKDRESKLGDHGVRKYDYEIGRFTSVDPLFEKFHGWSPYNYSFNNPINLVDRSGEAADVLIDLGFIAYDLYDMGKSLMDGKGITSTQFGALGADFICALTPVLVGGGLVVRAGAKADDAVVAVKAVDRIIDTKKIAQKGEFRKLKEKEIEDILGKDFHGDKGIKNILKKDQEISKSLKKTGDTNFDFYLNKDTQEILLRGNKSGKYIKSDIFIK